MVQLGDAAQVGQHQLVAAVPAFYPVCAAGLPELGNFFGDEEQFHDVFAGEVFNEKGERLFTLEERKWFFFGFLIVWHVFVK